MKPSSCPAPRAGAFDPRGSSTEPPGRPGQPSPVSSGADAGATLLYAQASTKGLLSVVAVLSSLYPIVIVVLARVLLAERIARPPLAGVAVALAGVALISAG